MRRWTGVCDVGLDEVASSGGREALSEKLDSFGPGVPYAIIGWKEACRTVHEVLAQRQRRKGSLPMPAVFVAVCGAPAETSRYADERLKCDVVGYHEHDGAGPRDEADKIARRATWVDTQKWEAYTDKSFRCEHRLMAGAHNNDGRDASEEAVWRTELCECLAVELNIGFLHLWLLDTGVDDADIARLEKNGLMATEDTWTQLSESVLDRMLADAAAGIGLTSRCKIMSGVARLRKRIVARDGDDLAIVASDPDATGWLYWLIGLGSGVILTVVPVGAVVAWDDAWSRELTSMEAFYRVTVPISVVFVLLLLLCPPLSMFFARDMLEERSFGFNSKQHAIDSLMNIGVVSALLLTMVTAAIQADVPTDGARSLISQYYIAYLYMSLYFSTSATGMSALCLMYVQPLEGAAAERFMSTMALYFGEPFMGMTVSLGLFVAALVLWVWSVYGGAVGWVALVCTYMLEVRTIVTLQNLSGWENVDVAHHERVRRNEIVSMDTASTSWVEGWGEVARLLRTSLERR